MKSGFISCPIPTNIESELWTIYTSIYLLCRIHSDISTPSIWLAVSITVYENKFGNYKS